MKCCIHFRYRLINTDVVINYEGYVKESKTNKKDYHKISIVKNTLEVVM